MRTTKLFFTAIMLALTALTVGAQTIDFQATLKRGNTLVAQEKYKEAIEEYNKVTNSGGDFYAQATYNIGVCHYELWQTEEAIVFYKRAIELKHSNYPKASYALGTALEEQEQLAEAKTAYEQAVNASRREFAPAIYRLGIVEAKAGDFKKAAALFKEAASHKGAHLPASHNNLGVMLVRLGFLAEAEREFVIALKLSSGQLNEAAVNLKLCRSLTENVTQNKLRISEALVLQ